MLVEDAKREIARRTRHGMGNVITQLVIWLALGISSFLFPETDQVAVVYVIGLAALWPLNLIVSRLLNVDLIIKNNPLSRLAALVGALPLLFVPLLTGVYFTAPQMAPWTLGVLASAQFLISIWIYDSLAYLFCTLGIIEVATLIGWLAPGATFIATPFAVGSILLITATLVGGAISSSKRATRRK